jgi:hypothetical protein
MYHKFGGLQKSHWKDKKSSDLKFRFFLITYNAWEGSILVLQIKWSKAVTY